MSLHHFRVLVGGFPQIYPPATSNKNLGMASREKGIFGGSGLIITTYRKSSSLFFDIYPQENDPIQKVLLVTLIKVIKITAQCTIIISLYYE